MYRYTTEYCVPVNSFLTGTQYTTEVGARWETKLPYQMFAVLSSLFGSAGRCVIHTITPKQSSLNLLELGRVLRSS